MCLKQCDFLQKSEFEDNEDEKQSGLQAKYKMAKQKLLEKQLSIDRTTVSEEEQM